MQEGNTNQNSETLAAIQTRGLELAQAAEVVAGLGLAGAQAEIQVAGLHEIAERCERLARSIGKQAVRDGDLSQVKLSRILGVAPMTVNRWVKDDETQED